MVNQAIDLKEANEYLKTKLNEKFGLLFKTKKEGNYLFNFSGGYTAVELFEKTPGVFRLTTERFHPENTNAKVVKRGLGKYSLLTKTPWRQKACEIKQIKNSFEFSFSANETKKAIDWALKSIETKIKPPDWIQLPNYIPPKEGVHLGVNCSYIWTKNGWDIGLMKGKK